MSEMPTNVQMLDYLMSIVDACNELIAINTTIAGGLVDDPHTVQEAAARSNELLEMLCQGIVMSQSQEPDIKDAFSHATKFINEA